MPVYDFKCEKCNKQKEILCTISQMENNELICDNLNCLGKMSRLFTKTNTRVITDPKSANFGVLGGHKER